MSLLDFLLDLILSAAIWPPESTQPVTEMITRNLAEGKKLSACKPDNLTAIYEPTV
jgi:hypothetical protein